MELSKEFKYGVLIFIGIGLFFLVMELLGLSNQLYLRFLNIFIVLYGASKTIQSNFAAGKFGFLDNYLSSILTSVIGIVFSVIGLIIYIHARGAEGYLATLSDGFVFAGGKASINEYCIGLLFEGIASAAVGCLLLMQYWDGKVPKKHYTA
jgi:hypothetical protein